MARLILATLMTVTLGGGAAWAQASDHDSHHPPAAESPAPVPAQPLPSQPSMRGQQGMMGGMPMMMNMMRDTPMMNMMETMGPGSAGMIDRIEGRIAFLRAELQITEAQANTWNAFADALRSNAKRLGEVRASMRSGPIQAATLIERLDLQERWLLARLEGTRAIKSALSNLYGALSEDQKKTANELLAAHMRMGAGMMAMMPRQAPSPQMQPGAH
jgi:LTXXQ motif family protein